MSYAAHAHFNDYSPADFGWAARDPMRNSALLVPFSHSGVTFGPMHRDVVPVFTAVLDELVPHIDGGLVAGQCGCYNPNSVTVGGSRSFHTYAIAIDVNWGSNPMYAHDHPTGPHTLPSLTSQIAQKYGCEWGGDWSYPQDWMHIECHLDPADARAVSRIGSDKYLRRRWPAFMGLGDYFGLISGPAHSHGGYYPNERPSITAIQNRLTALGYNPGRHDGIFGPQTGRAVAAWQARVAPKTTDRPGQIWADDWARLFTY